MNILYIGDIVGRPGRLAVKQFLPGIVQSRSVDLVIANAENIAHGIGATPTLVDELRCLGIHLFAMGNHTWRKQEMVDGIDALTDVARPANYPKSAPGRGCVLHTFADGTRAALINVTGRVYMDPVDCPFAAVERELAALTDDVRYVVIDIHAEATSEKAAMAWHLDGRSTAVVGTHTHVLTADERLLPHKTAFISDVGMCGPYNSILGVKKELVIDKLIMGLPRKWEVADGPVQFSAVLIEADPDSGLARGIERIHEISATRPGM